MKIQSPKERTIDPASYLINVQEFKIKVFLFVLISLIWACQPIQKENSVDQNQSVPPDYIIVEDLPAPLIAKYIDPKTVSPPVVVPLKGKPKVFAAHPNIHLLKAPEVVEIPDDLNVITYGQDGLPLPITIPVKGKIVPALQPKPISAKAMRKKYGAIYNIQILSDEQGLNSPYVLSMLEDSRGHIWFGTINDGVIRFDGQHFYQYTTKEGLLNLGARTIIEDSKGNIWFSGIGTKGICYYDGRNFVHFTQEHGLGEDVSTSVLEDSRGNIWFYNEDLYSFDGSSFTIFKMNEVLVNESETQTSYFGDDHIIKIYEDRKGIFWLGTRGIGVMKFDGQNITYLTKEQGLVDNFIGSIMEDRQGRIWFGSESEGVKGKGLSCYTPQVQNSFNTSGTFTNYSSEQGLIGNRITSLLEDDNGAIWISNYDGGINHFDGNKFTHFTTEEGLSFSSILSLMQDSKGNIWAGSNGRGVSRYQPNSFRHFTKEQGFSENGESNMFEDLDGNLWMSNWYDGILKYDGNKFTNFTEEEGMLQDFVQAFTEDSKGNLWIATRDKGICRFDGKTFTYYTKDQGLFNHFIYDIHIDQYDQLWVASGWDGVNRLNPETGVFTHFIGNPKEGIGGGIIHEDKQGELWFGGEGYLAKYNREQDQIDFVCQFETLNDDLTDTEWIWLEYVIEDDNDNLWFGSPISVFQVKQNGDEIENNLPKYSKGKQLPDKYFISMSLDKNKNLWISTDANGITVLEGGLENLGQPEEHWIEYGKEDGLQGRNPGRTFIDSKNQLWLGKPVTTLDLNNFKFPNQPPENLNLSHIDIKQKFIDYASLSDSNYQNTLSFGHLLSKSFESTLAFQNIPIGLDIPYNLNHLTFNFAATDWDAIEKIQYSYILEGLDKEWSEPFSESKADYRHIPYGDYTFKVKAIGQAKIWTDPLEYTFTIQPPWWHTWWAYGIYVLIAIGILGWYIRNTQRKIRLKQEQLETEQYLNQELKELNIANGRFVPHEFLKILGKSSLKELQLGDQTETKMTVLFLDIRDYTRLSEKMSPKDNFRLINSFLGRLGPIIKEHGGFICMYTGDGMMALFKDNHEQAVKAAVEMQKSLQQYNRKRFVANRIPIKVGIGLNTGKLMLGVIGDESRYDTSVLSDAVNTASRVEGLTKAFGCQIIVSEETLNEMNISDSVDGPDTICGDFRFLGKVKVKGKDKTLKIYDFYDGESTEIHSLKSKTRGQFEKALEHYYNRKFGKAADLFKVIIEEYPGDAATHYYMDKSLKYIIDGVDAEWSGVERMENK